MAIVAQGKQKPRLYRSRTAFLGGVCAGIATYFDMDSLALRVMALLLVFFTAGLAAVAYVLLWIIVPIQPDSAGPYDVLARDMRVATFEDAPYYLLTDERGREEVVRLPFRGLSRTARVVVIAVFVLFSAAVAVVLSLVFPGVPWWEFWPVLPFIMGLLLIMLPMRSRYSAALRGAGVVLTVASVAVLPVATGLFAPHTISFTIELFWPFLLAAGLLFWAGIQCRSSALIMFGTCSFIAFCVFGAVFCIVPGPLGLLDTPFGIFEPAAVGLFAR